MSKPDCLIVTDARNLPHSGSYYGLVHGLTADLIKVDTFGVNFSFADQVCLDLDTLSRISAVHDRTLIFTPKIQEFHARAKCLDLPYVNPPETMGVCASKLSAYEVVKPTGIYQPETIQVTSMSDLERMLSVAEGHKVVVKPECGGMGAGVYFLTEDGKQVKVVWKDSGDGKITERQEIMPILNFYKQIVLGEGRDTTGDTRAGSTEQRWIAQQCVDLRDEDGFAQDMRVIEQRDGSGELVVSKMHGRMASSVQVPLTNIDRGGKQVPIERVLKGSPFKVDDIVEACHMVDEAIECHTGKRIGEIGHDFAIVKVDGSPRICFIEANSMPGYLFNSWDAATSSTRVDLLDEQDRGLLMRPMRYLEKLALQK